MQETHSKIVLNCIFFTVLLTSASVINHSLQLVPAIAGSSNSSIQPNDNHDNDNNLPLQLAPNSSLPVRPAASGFVSYSCSGGFGRDLDVDSCADTLTQVGLRATVLSFGMRNTGSFNILLPQRYIGLDGKCAIEPELAPDVAEARMSLEDISLASLVIVNNCVSKSNLGGLAKDFGPGGEDKLRVIVGKYDPQNVRCYGMMRNPAIQHSCQGILSTMPADVTDVVFGPQSAPLAAVKLPYLLVSRDLKCKITIRTTGKGDGNLDVWSWIKFWEVAVALVGMCVRAGKEGVQTRLGEKGYLYMEVGGPVDV